MIPRVTCCGHRVIGARAGSMTFDAFTIKRMGGELMTNDVMEVRASISTCRVAPKNRDAGQTLRRLV